MIANRSGVSFTRTDSATEYASPTPVLFNSMLGVADAHASVSTTPPDDTEGIPDALILPLEEHADVDKLEAVIVSTAKLRLHDSILGWIP